MARPKKSEERLIEIRNQIILVCVRGGKLEFDPGELNQSEVAYILRLPRNTVSTIKKKHEGKR
jgi:hypothetical protein